MNFSDKMSSLWNLRQIMHFTPKDDDKCIPHMFPYPPIGSYTSDEGKICNPKCKICTLCKSTSGTEEMSDISDLCKWHRLRMGICNVYACKCGNFMYCQGDGIARNQFRTYYDCPDMPVFDSFGKFYCCGSCQNRDAEVAMCGEMRVCKDHLYRHNRADLQYLPENSESS